MKTDEQVLEKIDELLHNWKTGMSDTNFTLNYVWGLAVTWHAKQGVRMEGVPESDGYTDAREGRTRRTYTELADQQSYDKGYDAGLRATGEAMVAIARRRKAERAKK